MRIPSAPAPASVPAPHQRSGERAAGRPGRSYGLLSTFPPTACGLATFTAALADGLVETGATAGVVRVADGRRSSDPRVIGELDNGVPASVDAAAERLGRHDVVIVQHEYGLYGGPDGDEVVDLLRKLTVPSIVVAHTVLLEATDHQRSVLEEVADRAGRLVVMTEAARTRLLDLFEVDPAKVATIPHGAAVPAPRHRLAPPARPMLLTWGLLGPGKGIEWAVDALAELSDLRPRPQYVIAGRTHPKVLAAEGDMYREMLVERTWTRGVANSVTFDSSYRTVRSLTHMIQDAAVVVLPYDSRDQVTSGVLVDALAAGRPVVATAFPHAIEVLSDGAGCVVPHGDAPAMAAALRRILTDAELARSMAAAAARIAPTLRWSTVAGQYADLAEQLLARRGAVVA